MQSGSQARLWVAFSTFDVGGTQVRYAAFAKHFGDRYAHIIVAMDGVTSARERFAQPVQVQFPSIDVRKGDIIGNCLRFRTMLHMARPDCLVTHNWGSI